MTKLREDCKWKFLSLRWQWLKSVEVTYATRVILNSLQEKIYNTLQYLKNIHENDDTGHFDEEKRSQRLSANQFSKIYVVLLWFETHIAVKKEAIDLHESSELPLRHLKHRGLEYGWSDARKQQTGNMWKGMKFDTSATPSVKQLSDYWLRNTGCPKKAGRFFLLVLYRWSAVQPFEKKEFLTVYIFLDMMFVYLLKLH